MVKVGLVVKKDREAEQKAQAFEQWLTKRNITVVRQQHRGQREREVAVGDGAPEGPLSLQRHREHRPLGGGQGAPSLELGHGGGGRMSGELIEHLFRPAFAGLGGEQKHKTEFSFESDHPEVFASEDHAATPVELVLAGLATGTLTGVVGVGGGFLIVPALVLFAGIPTRRAIGTSLAIIALQSFAGFARHAALAEANGITLDWQLIGLFCNWAGGVGVPDDPRFANTRMDSPFDYLPLTMQSAEEAYELVLKGAGASRARDAVDRRIVEEVRTGTAPHGTNGIIDSQEQVGSWLTSLIMASWFLPPSRLAFKNVISRSVMCCVNS